MSVTYAANVRKSEAKSGAKAPSDLDFAEYTADMIEQLEQMYRRMGHVRTASLLRAALKSSENDFADLRKA